MKSQQKSNRRR